MYVVGGTDCPLGGRRSEYPHPVPPQLDPPAEVGALECALGLRSEAHGDEEVLELVPA